MLLLKCVSCGERKQKDAYYKWPRYSFWVRTTCKDCEKKYKEENKERLLTGRRKYRETNREKINERCREYGRKNKEKIAEYRREFRLANKELVANREKQYKDNRTEELWFNRRTFHEKTRRYVIKHDIRPNICPICWEESKIQMHHPSYDVFEDWSYVVFCCPTCHAWIHAWLVECPQPINLLTLK